MRALIRTFARAAVALALLPGLYLAAALLGAVVPQNRGWAEADRGITIWIDATPAHTELILPVAAAGHDWRGRIRAEHFPDGLSPSAFLSFSWGERNFFLTTPTWADFRLSAGLRALVAGHATLIHVYRIDRMPQGSPIRLAPEAYRRLVAHLEAQFADGGMPLPGYGAADAFFPARGRYTPLHTCNQWTRDALAAAGVRVGRWTPFAQSLMWRFPRQGEEAG